MSAAEVPAAGRVATARAAVDQKQIHSLATGKRLTATLVSPVPSNEVAKLFG
jgi:hypothetical protein